ncbi:alpha/beta hydrolase [Pelagibius sp.]|uniref:alpha/beta hydrolase n=1 Tax=Pelagibius sp. TaxID=1931238 RepID=UPI002623B1AC|nr:alpha/beta hydrolase [Pelagibius sp.]
MRRARSPVRLLVLSLLLLAGACAPRLAPPGPGFDSPARQGLEVAGPQFTAEHFITADATALPLKSWQPPAGEAPHGVVLALHGFNDYSNAFSASGPALAEQGLLVYAYDQRGFGAAPHSGLWAGVDRLTGDLGDAAALLRARHPELPLFLLGESMGGAVVLAALAGPNPPQPAGVILSSPAVWARTTMPLGQRVALWLGARLIPWARFSGRGLGIQASDNIEMLRGLGRDPLFIKETRVDAVFGLVNLMDAAYEAAPRIETDALLLYGEKDEVVPADPTYAFWGRLPPEAAARQRRALYTEGWHMLLRDLQAQVVIDDIAAWTRDRAAPLPSQAEAYAAEVLAGLAAEGEKETAATKPEDCAEVAC